MKKIAFIENGVVGVVLNTDESLHNFFLHGERVELSGSTESVTAGWSYSGGLFREPEQTLPDTSYTPSQD